MCEGKFQKRAKMLSVIKEKYNDFLESLVEYKNHKGIGFNLYLAFLTASIPITYIFFGIIIPNNPHINLFFIISIFFIELILFLILPYRFYKNNFGFEVKLKMPHYYSIADDRTETRLDKIELNEDISLKFSFNLSFGKKIGKILPNNHYDLIFSINDYIKITPVSVWNDKWIENDKNKPFLRCVYQNEKKRLFTFKIELNPNFIGNIPPGEYNLDILCCSNKEKKIHDESIEIIT